MGERGGFDSGPAYSVSVRTRDLRQDFNHLSKLDEELNAEKLIADALRRV